MSCDCKEQVSAAMSDHYGKQKDVAKVISVDLDGYGLALIGNSLQFRGRMDATIKIETKLKSGAIKPKKLRTFMAFSYCPFCGKPVDGEPGADKPATPPESKP